MKKNKILIIEDEKSISSSLKLILEDEGFLVSVEEKGLTGLKCFKRFDLLILDLMLPDIDGLEILAKIRNEDVKFPVLIVSAKSAQEDLIKGLKLGADDYVTKPFSLNELLMRIKRTLKRQLLYEGAIKLYQFGNNIIDFTNLSATTCKGKRELTTQEACLLSLLINNKGKIISRNDLMEEIWGHNRAIESRTIDNFMVRFRKYFEQDPKHPKHILTKRGEGYLFLN